jgi:mannose/fructose/N-acetylgalactosamine-specific phosphotransferase system component IIC
MEETEKKPGGGVPRGLPIAGVICLILGIIALQIVPNAFSDEQLADNVILSAIPFILIFASIIIFFMSLVWFISSKLSGNISEKVYRPIEYLLIGGIVFGALLMFQPWVFQLFRVGFFMLLLSLILYIVWSHVRPRDPSLSDELAGMSDSN